MGQLPLTRAKSTPMVLALDIGTKLGWAVGGTLNHKQRVFDSGMINLGKVVVNQRLSELWRKLTDIKREHEPLWAVVEDWVGGLRTKVGKPISTRAPIVCGEYLGVIRLWAISNGLMWRDPVNSATLKKAATGNGHASKAVMVSAANRRWSLNPPCVDDNHADALHLLGYTLDTWQPEVEF